MTIASPAIDSVFRPTLNSPDLGCHVRQAHPFEVDYKFHIWEETSPLTRDVHQVYFRVVCGEAAFYQRCHVYMSPVWVPPGWPGDAMLGGNHRPRPTDWAKFPVQARAYRYIFHGEHRNPSEHSWKWNAAVGHSYDIYENGTLSRVGWDDTGGDMDMNDLIIEVAVVDRRSYFDEFVIADMDEVALEHFTEQVLPSRTDQHRHERR
jgi:hypothetical protein